MQKISRCRIGKYKAAVPWLLLLDAMARPINSDALNIGEISIASAVEMRFHNCTGGLAFNDEVILAIGA